MFRVVLTQLNLSGNAITDTPKICFHGDSTSLQLVSEVTVTSNMSLLLRRSLEGHCRDYSDHVLFISRLLSLNCYKREIL